MDMETKNLAENGNLDSSSSLILIFLVFHIYLYIYN